MKKQSFVRAKQYRAKTKGMRRYIKFLKKFRAKKGRKNIEEWRKTNAWDII